jgi:fucose 4-O-acetylase-like acetyltransferase
MVRTQSRLVFLDVAKGIAILFVVFGHAIGGIARSHCCGSGILADEVSYVVYTFHMPLFFFISGLLAVGRRTADIRSSLAQTAAPIIYPYLLWSVLQTSLALAAGSAANQPRDFTTLLSVLWKPTDQFWFIYTLFFIRIIDVLFFGSLTRSQTAILTCGVFGLFLELFWNSTDVGNLANLLYGLQFYLLGRCFTRDDVRRLPSLTTVVALFGLLGFSWFGFNHDIHHRSIAPAALAGIVMALGLALEIERRNGCLSSLLSLLGRHSMAIYLMHVIATGAARFLLIRTSWDVSYWIAVVITTGAGAFIPLVVAVAADRWDMSYYLGFAWSRHAKALTKQET